MNSDNRTIRDRYRRRGASLIAVMLVLSTSIVMAIAFLHSQTTALIAASNGLKTSFARKSAETGLAAALDVMQTPSWGGVTDVLAAEVGRNAEGAWSYRVTFEPVAGDGSEIGAATAALMVKVRSEGRWQSLESSRPVTRTLLATLKLSPRLPGRPSRDGDLVEANDRADDVFGFTAAREFAVFVTDNSDALFVKPQTRIDGNVAVGGRMDFYGGLACDANELAELFAGLGRDNGGGAGATSPHPLAGQVSFDESVDSATTDALTRLQVPYTQTGAFALPAFDPTRFQTYRLYGGGFDYQAQLVGSTLANVSLGPTSSNPLGIFYCNGSVTVGSNVEIRGTLVASSNVTFEGVNIAIAPFDWRNGSGGTPVVDRSYWPILPAVVSGGNVTTLASSRVYLVGGVLTTQDFIVNTPDYVEDSALLNYDGTATAKPLGGGRSEIQVADITSLLSLTIDSRHAVRLNGPNGRWYPVLSGDVATAKFVVRGEVDFATPVDCRFRPRRLASLDIAGPTVARRVIFNNPAAWGGISTASWQNYYNNWRTKQEGILGLLLARPNLTFSRSLAEDGVPFAPTVCITRPSNVNYACEPPLFQADSSARTAGGGYRWELVSWHERSP